MPRRKKVDTESAVEAPKKKVKEVEISKLPTSLVVDADFDVEKLRSYNFKDCGVVFKSGKEKKRFLVTSKL